MRSVRRQSHAGSALAAATDVLAMLLLLPSLHDGDACDHRPSPSASHDLLAIFAAPPPPPPATPSPQLIASRAGDFVQPVSPRGLSASLAAPALAPPSLALPVEAPVSLRWGTWVLEVAYCATTSPRLAHTRPVRHLVSSGRDSNEAL
eukprot:360919-Chlamydomonas_euryale.AAC.3